jgi:hypothetical protein
MILLQPVMLLKDWTLKWQLSHLWHCEGKQERKICGRTDSCICPWRLVKTENHKSENWIMPRNLNEIVRSWIRLQGTAYLDPGALGDNLGPSGHGLLGQLTEEQEPHQGVCECIITYPPPPSGNNVGLFPCYNAYSAVYDPWVHIFIPPPPF